MWEWWFKKVGTKDWSPLSEVVVDVGSLRVGHGIVFTGTCPGKNAGDFEYTERVPMTPMYMVHVSKAFVKHIMEDF